VIRAILLVMLSLSLACAGETAESAAALDQDTLEMVKAFVKMPTEDLPVGHIPKFLAVDPRALPAGLRQSFAAKRLELYTLKHVAEGKKKGGVRMPEENCSAPGEAEGQSLKVMRLAGFEEISDDEERFVKEKTNCTEHDLMCEFTLKVLLNKRSARRRLFLHMKDPLFALVGQYRETGRLRQTKFFGIGNPVCASRLK